MKLETSSAIERSVIDLETGLRGFALTHQARFLEPYRNALAVLPAELEALRVEAAETPGKPERALGIARAVASYERNYAASQATLHAVPSPRAMVAAASTGKVLVDALRRRFATFNRAEDVWVQTDKLKTASSARRGLRIAEGGFALTILMLGALAAYIRRSILTPVSRVADAASRRREGRLGVRVPETGHGEIASLASSFNAMASTLEQRDRAFSAAHNRLQSVLDNASAVIYIKDARGTISACQSGL